MKPGSFLIVESLDRLMREELVDAFELVLLLVNRGIRIVRLSPVESILEKPMKVVRLTLAIVELSRGNGERKRKSDLSEADWERRRVEARSSGRVMSLKTKAWLTREANKLVFKSGAKEVIRRMAQMCTAGRGFRAIARKLNDEKVPCWSGGPWGYVCVRASADAPRRTPAGRSGCASERSGMSDARPRSRL